MKRIYTKTFYVTSAVALVVITCSALFQTTGETAISDSIPGSCTIFTASYGEKVLFGNNEDYTNPKTYYWVDPGGEGNYGGCISVLKTIFFKVGLMRKACSLMPMLFRRHV